MDRVYAAALDGFGRHMVVGGRDKMVAMYSLRSPKTEEASRFATEAERRYPLSATPDNTSAANLFLGEKSGSLKNCVITM